MCALCTIFKNELEVHTYTYTHTVQHMTCAHTHTNTHTENPTLLNFSVSHILVCAVCHFSSLEATAELFWFDMQRKYFWQKELQFGTKVLFSLIPHTDIFLLCLQISFKRAALGHQCTYELKFIPWNSSWFHLPRMLKCKWAKVRGNKVITWKARDDG